IIGFLSLNFSDSPPFGDLGNITAAGVAGAWFYSILLLPVLMSLLPVRVKESKTVGKNYLDNLADFVIEKRTMVLTGMTALVIGLAIMAPQNVINDQFIQYFDKSVEFRADSDFAAENLSGMYQLQWSIPAREAGGISDPEYLKNIDDFANWLRVQNGVENVQTVSDVFLRLNKNMHGDDPAMYVLPEDRNMAAQFLLLYEMSLPYGLDLNNQINVDKSAVRMVATTENYTTNDLRDLDIKATEWLGTKFNDEGLEASGPVMMFTFITKRNTESMLIGTTMALVLISICLLIALRSFKLGALSLVPNLVPMIMTFGIWAVFVGQMDLAATIVAATSLGIVVDATVHFLSKYQRAQREKGFNAEQSVRYAFANVGVALMATSAILIAGFVVLNWSTFRLNASMGQMTAIAIAAALLADFLLLPALLLTIDKHKNKNSTKDVLTEQPAE
ncbi:MAG: MMPL family transporter, partial [Emcibacteraceae bacterium]|nr:MMPL family transporter [Emcibacteraceae bacterium]